MLNLDLSLKILPSIHQDCKFDRFLTEFKFAFKRYLQVQVQVRVLRTSFFEFKFEFGKNDRVQRVRVRSPGFYRSQWHEQINNMHHFFWLNYGRNVLIITSQRAGDRSCVTGLIRGWSRSHLTYVTGAADSKSASSLHSLPQLPLNFQFNII